MSIEFSANLAKTLKGAPLGCLWVLLFERQPVSAQYLERHTGYSDKSVNSALLLLEEMGMISRNGRYTWQIAINVEQLPLMNDLLPDGSDGSTSADPSTPDGSTPGNTPSAGSSPTEPGAGTGVGEIPSRRNSESEKFRLPVVETAENTEKAPPESENFRLPRPSIKTSSRSINLESRKDLLLARAESELLEIFDRFGVFEPKRSQLANKPGMTPRIALYHLTTCRDVPLAIYRMEHRFKVPDGWETQLDESPLSPSACGEGGQIPADQVEAFGRALECLRANIPPGVFVNYTSGMRLAAPVEAGVIQIAVANSFVIREMEPYQQSLSGYLASEFGMPVELTFQIM